jgi:hypothetical protein
MFLFWLMILPIPNSASMCPKKKRRRIALREAVGFAACFLMMFAISLQGQIAGSAGIVELTHSIVSH